METEQSPKVKRWKLAIQHYDFDLQHIKGEDNIEADAFSRLVHLPSKEGEQLALHDLETIDQLDSQKYQIIKKVHGKIHGHGGINRTMTLLKNANKTWNGIRRDVETFIKRCPCCQKMSQLKPRIHIKPFTLAAYYPMRRICIDTIGPINIQDDDREKYIIVIIDAFSRYVNLYATKDTSAMSAIRALTDWVSTFGCPSEIVSDNGTQYVNELIGQFLDITDIEHNLIQAYSKEENGLVERANKEVSRHITSIVFDTQLRKDWVQYLPFVKRIMNSQVHSSIGVSPSQIIFGNSVNLDTNILVPPETPVRGTNSTYNEYIDKMLTYQSYIIDLAQKQQEQTDSFHIAKRQSEILTEFPINSYVLCEYEVKKPSKFHTNLHGPYRVVNITKNGTVYTVQHLVTNKFYDYHIKFLREFHYDKNIDPVEVAKHDDEFDDIVLVLDHKFKNSKKRARDLQFQVIWGKNKNPEWQDWNSTISANEKIHEYLKANQLRKYVPRKYTWPKDHPEYEPPTKKVKWADQQT
jgi:hypothetical protein